MRQGPWCGSSEASLRITIREHASTVVFVLDDNRLTSPPRRQLNPLIVQMNATITTIATFLITHSGVPMGTVAWLMRRAAHMARP